MEELVKDVDEVKSVLVVMFACLAAWFTIAGFVMIKYFVAIVRVRRDLVDLFNKLDVLIRNDRIELVQQISSTQRLVNNMHSVDKIVSEIDTRRRTKKLGDKN